MRTIIVCQLSLVFSAYAALQPPTSLIVTTATSREVKLTWTAGASETNQYVIERRPLDGDTFAPIGAVVPDTNKVLATAYTETGFDPFTAYVYRVRGVNTTPLPNDTSEATNSVTVGPPPYGYTRVVSTPDKLQFETNFGRHTQMALDGSGDPVLTWLVLNPNEDDDFVDSELWFLRWDRAHFKWTEPRKIATVGDISISGPATNVRLAVDSSIGAIAAVFIDATDPSLERVSLVDSTDGGVTWRKRDIATDPAQGFRYPSVALGAGKVHVSFFHDVDGIRYVTGSLADDPTTWSSELVPLTGGGMYYEADSDVALDSAGKPAVAYVVSAEDGHREIFYRPGSAPVVANFSTSYTGDFWQLRLAFSGVNPRIAFLGEMDDHYFEDYDHTLFVLSSNDGGATWNPRVNVASDGNRSLSGPIDVSFDSKGRGAIITEENGGNSDRVQCGVPKLALSDESLNWKMCGVTATYTSGAASPNVRFVANDTMYVAFQTPQYQFDPADPKELAPGVYFWRGPIAFTFPSRPPE